MKKIVLVAITVIIAFSCTTEPKKEETLKKVEVVEVEKVNKLIFQLELKTDTSDDFVLSSKDIFLSNSQSMNLSIKQSVKKSETFQKINFEFPEDIVPDVDLVLSLGKNTEKEITIQKLNLEFGSIQYEIAPSEMKKYFGMNKFVEFDPATGILKVKKVDGKFNPIVRLKQKYLIELSK